MTEQEQEDFAKAINSAHYSIVDAINPIRLDFSKKLHEWIISTLVFRRIIVPSKITIEWMRENHVEFLETQEAHEIHHKGEVIGRFKYSIIWNQNLKN